MGKTKVGGCKTPEPAILIRKNYAIKTMLK